MVSPTGWPNSPATGCLRPRSRPWSGVSMASVGAGSTHTSSTSSRWCSGCPSSLSSPRHSARPATWLTPAVRSTTSTPPCSGVSTRSSTWTTGSPVSTPNRGVDVAAAPNGNTSPIPSTWREDYRRWRDQPLRGITRTCDGLDEAVHALGAFFDQVRRSGIRSFVTNAAAADGPEDFHQGIAYMTERLAARRPAIADRWQAFVTHKRAAARAELLSLVDNSGVYPTSGNGRAKETVRHATEALRPAPATTPGTDDRDPHRGGNPPQAGGSAQAPAEPARPYPRATGPEVHSVPLADSDAARLELPGGGEIYLHKRHQAPGGPVPPGWVAEHFGRWQGREAEVVYNPRRHDVIVTN